MMPQSRSVGSASAELPADALPVRSRNSQHLSRLDQVRVGDATGIGNDLVLVAVAVEPLGDGPQCVAGLDGVGPRGFGFWLRGSGFLNGMLFLSRCGGFWLRRRWSVGLGLARPRRAVRGVQHQVAVVLQDETHVLLALGVGVPHRLVGGVENEVAVALDLGADYVFSVGL